MHLTPSQMALLLLSSALRATHALALPGASPNSLTPNAQTPSTNPPSIFEETSMEAAMAWVTQQTQQAPPQAQQFAEQSPEQSVEQEPPAQPPAPICFFYALDSIPPTSLLTPAQLQSTPPPFQRSIKVTCHPPGAPLIAWPAAAGSAEARDLVIMADVDGAGKWGTHTGYTRALFSALADVKSVPGWQRGLGLIRDPLAAEAVIRGTPVEAVEGESRMATTMRWVESAKKRLLEEKLWGNQFNDEE
ncbi:MAG: hypothetical protein M1829_000332 [Trizodia sp. TS-e1964]|nr:MAG: hypothetical protein M1829_000332 [Trizodia sp. TS-e1964]